jgi:ATP-dependent helicase HrpA
MDRVSDAVRDVTWMLEELRMSVFAQPEGVKGPVSPKRIRQQLAATDGV